MWLDVLDMPMINHFQASFASHFDEKMQKRQSPKRRLV